MEQTRTLGFFCSAGEKGGRGADSISLTFPVLAQVQRLSGHSFKLVKTEERDQRKALPVWGICIVNYPPPPSPSQVLAAHKKAEHRVRDAETERIWVNEAI